MCFARLIAIEDCWLKGNDYRLTINENADDKGNRTKCINQA
jgi:hypothetical protein